MNPENTHTNSKIILLEDDLPLPAKWVNIDESSGLPNSILKATPYLSPDKYIILVELLQMEFNVNTAYLIITFSDCKNLTQALDFITTDGDGYYNHPFIENDNKEKNCMICDSNSTMHLDVIHGNDASLSR